MRWILWAAVSSLPQTKKASLEDQLRLGAEHAAKHGGEIVDKLVVRGESRSIIRFDKAKKIEAYAKLEKHIEAKDFDVLCFLDRSRLGRTAPLSMTVVALCEEANILCYEIDNPPATLELSANHDEQLIGAIKSVGAERELKKLTAFRKRGMKQRVKDGKYPGILPYGYMLDPNSREYRVIINDHEAAIVRRIVSEYLSGRGTSIIADSLVADGVQSRNGKWVSRTVWRLIHRSARLAGEIEYRDNRTGEITSGAAKFDPILDQDTVQALLLEMKSRGKHRKLTSASQGTLYSGIFYCAACGARMRRLFAKGKKPYIFCPGDHDGQRYVKLDKMISEFLEAISNSDLSDFDMPEESKKATYEASIASIDESIAKLEKSRQRASDAFTDGIMSIEDYTRQSERIKQQRTHLLTERTKIESAIARERVDATRGVRAQEFLENVQSWLQHESKQQANQWLRSHIRLLIGDGKLQAIDIV